MKQNELKITWRWRYQISNIVKTIRWR